jgi:hypothetical protein
MQAKSFSFLFILVVLTIAIFNNGFLATDEYWVAMVRYLPAQLASFSQLVTIEDVKAPSQNFFFVLFSKMGLSLGIDHPYWQYRFVCWMTCLAALIPTLFAARRFLRNWSLCSSNWPWILPLVATAYFCTALVFSRAMYETLALPFMAWFFVFCFEYDQNGKRSALFGAVFAIVGAFLMRPQTAGSAGALLALCLLKKNYRDFSMSAALGLALFAIVGFIDLFVRGSWHYSFFQILNYNLAAGAEYGKSSPIHLFLVSFVFIWGPFWIFYVRKFPWAEHFRVFRSAWLILLFFVTTHSFFAQKFERFLIPLMPVYLILVCSLVVFLYETQRSRVLLVLAGLNLLLWVPANLSAPLGRLIEIVRAADQHPEVVELISVNNSVEWLPELLMKNKAPTLTQLKLEELPLPLVGRPWIIARENDLEKLKQKFPELREVQSLPQNPFESLAFKLNPKRNQLRAPIYLLSNP